MSTKHCYRCKQTKAETEFYRMNSDCKSCARAYRKANYAKKKAATKAEKSTKYCYRCKQTKDKTDFYRMNNDCKPCARAYRKAYYAKNKEAISVSSKIYRLKNKSLMTKKEKEECRVNAINQWIKCIGSYGCQHFHHEGTFAVMEMDKTGTRWWVDERSKQRIYLNRPRPKLIGFTNNGSLKDLVFCLSGLVIDLDRTLPIKLTGIKPPSKWDYSDDELEIIAKKGIELGLLRR